MSVFTLVIDSSQRCSVFAVAFCATLAPAAVFLVFVRADLFPLEMFSPRLKSESRPDHNPGRLLSLIKVPLKCRMSKIAAALLVFEERPEGCFCRWSFHVEYKNGLLVVQSFLF